ncbi:MAG TPA: hypothetical protein PK095_25435, partial [Myxococcota bacterium]|nr:hypothetical protein [Myxococcota bacterium]
MPADLVEDGVAHLGEAHAALEDGQALGELADGWRGEGLLEQEGRDILGLFAGETELRHRRL